VGDLEDPEIAETEAYDAVLCFEFLHHFPDPEKVIQNFYRWVKPGGKVYIFEPNGANITNRIFKAVRRLMGTVSPKMVTRYQLSSPNEVRNHFPEMYRSHAEKSGFIVIFSQGYSLWNTRPKSIDILNLFGYLRWALSKMFRTQDHIGMVFQKP
jgi:ubiquinone/menaquinone biosynthesis C-methylase UbiE